MHIFESMASWTACVVFTNCAQCAMYEAWRIIYKMRPIMQRTPRKYIHKQMSHIAYTAIQKPCHASCAKYPPYYTKLILNPTLNIQRSSRILRAASCTCIPCAAFAPQPCHLTLTSCRLLSYIPPFICFDMWITQCPNTRIGRYMHHCKHTQKVALHALHINAAARLSHQLHIIRL